MCKTKRKGWYHEVLALHKHALLTEVLSGTGMYLSQARSIRKPGGTL